MRASRAAILVAVCVLETAILLATPLVLPGDGWAAEACGGNPSGFQRLDPGDDESGTGRGERAPSERLSSDRVRSRGDEEEDSGIGGTGHAPDPGDDGDSGIGGTGIYGAVTQTDGLCVNGLEIVVPSRLALEASSGGTSDRALAVGQVVFVEAVRSDEGLVARRIVLAPDYAGQIEVADQSGRSLIVSGQPVRLAAHATRGDGVREGSLRVGDWIVVHGQLDANHILIASRVEPGNAREIRRADPGGTARVPAWLRDLGEHGELEYVSLEGFVSGTRARPEVGGIPFDLDGLRPDALRDDVRLGAKVRIGGRLAADQTLRVSPPPRALDPTRGLPRREPQPSGTDSRPQSRPETRPKHRPPTPPERPAITRPEIRRPTILRPTIVRPTIDRPTRDGR